MTPHASTLVLFGIPALALSVVALIGVGVFFVTGTRDARRYALGSAAWLTFAAVLGLSGFLTQFEAMPPHLLLLMVPTIGLPLMLARSSIGTALAKAPLELLIGFQAFRFPLELVMHQAALEGTMPTQMSYTGSNFDIASGVSAILVALLAAKQRAPRWLLFAWNALGTLLLLNILGIAVLSLPTFAVFGRGPERLNTWVAYFPFVWLPAGLVSAAVLGHVLLWRRLWSRDRRGPALGRLSSL